MMLHITEVKCLEGYKVAVIFNDGESGIADLSTVVQQGIFKSLLPPEKFALGRLDNELETIVWPGGLDLAPEFVYFQAFKEVPRFQSRFKAWGYV
jgi:hypothetical protein